MRNVERKNATPARTPAFYGRAVSLDGPRATISASERAAYQQNVKVLLGSRRTGQESKSAR